MPQVFAILLKSELPRSLLQAFEGYLESWDGYPFLVCTGFSQGEYFVRIEAVKKGTAGTGNTHDVRTAYLPCNLIDAILELTHEDPSQIGFAPGFL